MQSEKYSFKLWILIHLFCAFPLRIASVPVEGNAQKMQKLSEEADSQYLRDIMRFAKAAEMKNYMNEDINPCSDFYEFACGKWSKINPATNEHVSTGLFELLTKALNKKVVAILNSPPNANDTDIDKKVKNFYESCVNIKRPDEIIVGMMDDMYKEKLNDIIKEFGVMPALSDNTWDEEHFDWLETIAKIAHKYGISIIFSTGIMADFANNTVNRVYYGFANFLLESKSMYLDEVNNIYRETYRRIIKSKLIRYIGVNTTIAEQVAKEILDFEVQLASGLVDEKLGLGLPELSILTTVENAHEKYAPVFDVRKYFNITFGEIITDPIYEYGESFQINAVNVIKKTSKRVLANYIFYQLVTDFPSDKNCVDRTKKYFAKNIDNMIYRQYNNKPTELDIALIWRELKETFKWQLLSDKYKWIDSTTRQHALDKLDAMKMEINSYETTNFTEEFHELLITADDYIDNIKRILEWDVKKEIAKLHKPPQPLEAGETLSYTPANIIMENMIKVPVSVLQPYYLWATSYPQALKFGNLGALVGHELIHGFDDTGRKYDKVGNNINWWTNSSTKEFVKRANCFMEHYSQYIYGGHLLPKTALQSENIADNGGLRLAYAAYLRWYEEAVRSGENLSNETLPNMKYTSKQLFFISFAQMWCNDVLERVKLLQTSTDSHTPAKFRVIGTLSNFDEFAKEFQCAADTKMNTKNKCEIY